MSLSCPLPIYSKTFQQRVAVCIEALNRQKHCSLLSDSCWRKICKRFFSFFHKQIRESLSNLSHNKSNIVSITFYCKYICYWCSIGIGRRNVGFIFTHVLLGRHLDTRLLPSWNGSRAKKLRDPKGHKTIRPKDNSPHEKLALRQLAPYSEDHSPHFVIRCFV